MQAVVLPNVFSIAIRDKYVIAKMGTNAAIIR
jgi:hypothetical protein